MSVSAHTEPKHGHPTRTASAEADAPARRLGVPHDTPVVQAVRPTAADGALLGELEIALDRLNEAGAAESRQILASVEALLQSISSQIAAEMVFGAAVGHRNLLVRRRLTDFVVSWLPSPMAADTLFALARDSEDAVCLPAMRLAGQWRCSRVLQYMVDIVDWPSASHATPEKPVGLGAATVYNAVLSLLGATGWHDQAAQLTWEATGALPATIDVNLQLDEEVGRRLSGEAQTSECLVPGGWHSVGLSVDDIPSTEFGWQDAVGPNEVWLPPFLIDKYPVTVSEYDEFARSDEATSHEFCHPLEPIDKDHCRNTWWDNRFAPDSPATGVDWFDAFAFARWSDKDLPTEYQWECAARGPTGTVWPWGNEWKPNASQWIGRHCDRSPAGLSEWREVLGQVSDEWPSQPTAPVRQHEAFASGYGVCDMVGNAWEWTRSESRTRGAFLPSLQVDAQLAVSVVLKGGAWTSLPGLMFPSYRGHDAPTCRHNEIGFRCVRNVDWRIVNRHVEAALPSINTAVY